MESATVVGDVPVKYERVTDPTPMTVHVTWIMSAPGSVTTVSILVLDPSRTEGMPAGPMEMVGGTFATVTDARASEV